MIKRSFHRIPLTLKMVVLTVLVGFAVWAALDRVQSRTLKGLFQVQLAERLYQQATEDRLHFDNYIKAHNRLVRMIVLRKSFVDYLEENRWFQKEAEEDAGRIKYHLRPPEWFPGRSVLRTFAQPRYALLFDAQGEVREVYLSREERPPESLLKPTKRLLKLSHGQSFMTTLDGVPYLVTSESAEAPEKQARAMLMLATPIDDEFLTASQGAYHGPLVALVEGDSPRILTSSDLNLLPPGTMLSALKDRFLITGQEFFEYGGSELAVKFASFVSTGEIESVTAEVVSKGRQQRVIMVLMIIASFALIMFWITKRIERLTQRISDFSQRVLHKQPWEAERGDKLHILEDRFERLTEEVASSHEIINRGYHFKSAISSILQISLEPLSIEEQLGLILDAILSMPFLSSKGCIYLVEDEPDVLVMKAHRGLPQTMRSACARVSFGKCLCGASASSREIIFAEGIDDRHEIEWEGIFPHGHYCVPIASGGRVLGVMNLYVAEGHQRDPEEEGLLSSVANTLAGVIERKRAEEEKQRLQEQLIQAEKLSALGRLTANVAHEIRNPLTSIGGFARRLEKKFTAGTSGRDYAEIIKSEVDNLENILRNVLSYSREAPLNLERHDIREIIEESLSLYENICKEKSIYIRKSFGEVPRITVDKVQVTEVMNNLISNAIDSMPNGGRLTISTEKETLADLPFLKVRISDTGEGIPEDKLDMIFEPFYSTKVFRHGTGLGLSICKKIMEDHGGFIRLESRAGEGSTFSLYLPYKR